MSRIPTANVLVSFTKEPLEKLFSTGKLSKNLIDDLSDEGLLLFDAQSNPNFIEFSHSWGLAGGNEMKLTFIDPQSAFEKRYLSDSLLENVAAVSTKNPKNTDPIQALQNQAQKRELDSDGGDQWYSEYKKKYEEYYGNKNIYVAYGSGRNFETWAGPFLMKLTGATITVKGPKKITLQLTPTASPLQITNRRGAYGEIVDLDLKGLMMSCNGHSKPIEFKNIKEGGEVYEVDKPDKIENIDFHSIVVDTIRNYIYKATGNSNVIVLLPNINQICSEEILAIATEQRVKKQEKKETRADELSKSRARADVDLAINNEIKKIQEKDAVLAAAMKDVNGP